MKIYPVRYWATGSLVDSTRVQVKPFTSLVKAREFFHKIQDTEGVEAEVLDPEDYTLNKVGVLEAYERGQQLVREKAKEVLTEPV